MKLDLRHLEQFVALAEEGQVGRAALRLGMAQPPLSQALQRMEKALGFKLFDRNRRRLALTAAGQTLLTQAKPLLAQAELAESLAARVATGKRSRLRIAFPPWSLVRALPLGIQAFRKRWPGAEIRLDERTSAQQVDFLRKGTQDVGIINLSLASAEGLEIRSIERSLQVAAIPSGWPLGRRKSVRLADLAQQPFVMFPQSWSPRLYSDFVRACERSGFTPQVVQRTTQIYAMLNLVASEVGIALADEACRNMGVSGVSLVPIVDLPETFHHDFALAWSPQSQSPVIMGFVESMERAAAALRPAPAVRPER